MSVANSDSGLDATLLESLVDRAVDGMVVVDPQGTHLLANRAFCAMTGFTAEELLHRGAPHPYWPPEHIEHIVGAWNETSGGGPETYEFIFRRKNEERFPVSVRPAFVDIEGRAYIIAIVSDLTAARARERELLESQHLVEALSAGGLLAWWHWNLADGASTVSDSYYTQLGYEPGAWKPSYEAWAERVHPDDIARADEDMQLLLTDRVSSFEAEHRLRTSDGGWRWMLARGFVMERTADGAPASLMGIHQDIQAVKEREAQLQRFQKMEVVGQMAGGVAHDFNNVLAVMELGLERLRDEPGATQEVLGDLEQAVERAAGLTRSLLQYTRGQDGALERLKVADLLSHTRQLVASAIPASVGTSWDPVDPKLAVEAPREAVERAVLNLVINARDAMVGPGRITVTARRETVLPDRAQSLGIRPADYVAIIVADDGPGMTPEVLARCTEPLFTTKSKNKGTGLGLSITQKLMSNLGGTLLLESELGNGTNATLYLPAFDDEVPAVLLLEQFEEAVQELHAEGSVLVVDDEPALARVLATNLERLGYSVQHTDNPRRALAMLEDSPVDLLITDVVMPFTIDGIELARRSKRLCSALEVIFVTGYFDEDRQAELQALGVLVQKPFKLERLAHTMKTLMRKSEP